MSYYNGRYFACSPDLLDKLLADKNIKSENQISIEIEYFDTFDQLLYKKGKYLSLQAGEYFLEEISSGILLTQFSPADKIEFSYQIEDPPTRKIIHALIDVRRLLTLFKVKRSTFSFKLLNEEGKTALTLNYLAITSLKPQRQQSLILLQVVQLKESEKQLHNFLSTFDLVELDGSENNLFKYLIRNFDIPLNEYSSRLSLKFYPEETAIASLKKILLALIPIIRANEQGILEDIDTEFLHDFRVAFRKTRSALSLIKDVLPSDLLKTYKTRLKEIVKQTNHLRDLDVYLVQQDYYKSLLPPDLSISLEPFFLKLNQLRELELAVVRKLLRSATYNQVISDWQKALQQEFASEILPVNAQLPVFQLAGNLIYKRYQKIIELGTAIHHHTQDEQLHRLRIQCKKLRYLMNFFESLFPETKILMLLKKLKLFQNKLGKINDYSFQINWLNRFSSEFLDSEETGKTNAALTALITILSNKKELLKTSLKADFKSFADRGNQSLFKQLFNSGK